ncbi:MAG: fluoride efflux transporter CrcB [Labilithrix sp.]|nr:fluoride efflux transporter CrcB [Labilithrix sp.]
MTRLLLVCLAGAIGSGARYLVVTWTQRAFGESFPWGVLGVNVFGSFLIALVSVLAVSKIEMSETARLTLTAGFLGGLTTYSSFNQDTLSMLDRRLYGTAALYVLATLASCLLAGALGTKLARSM